jgi:hypothetical protein
MQGCIYAQKYYPFNRCRRRVHCSINCIILYSKLTFRNVNYISVSWIVGARGCSWTPGFVLYLEWYPVTLHLERSKLLPQTNQCNSWSVHLLLCLPKSWVLCRSNEIWNEGIPVLITCSMLKGWSVLNWESLIEGAGGGDVGCSGSSRLIAHSREFIAGNKYPVGRKSREGKDILATWVVFRLTIGSGETNGVCAWGYICAADGGTPGRDIPNVRAVHLQLTSYI